MHYRKFLKIFPAFFLLITVTTIYSASSTNGVKQANRRAVHPENAVMDGLQLHTIVQGSDALENPSGIITKFGYLNDGDTSKDAGAQAELAARGGWGSIFRVNFAKGTSTGTISIFVLGNATRSSFDNIAFLDENTLLVAEDRGDGLHTSLNRLDSIWMFDVRVQNPSGARFVALGRDASSEVDAGHLDAGTEGYQNDGDNEPTGLHVSTGKAYISEMVGTIQDPESRRVFFTQQHGLNRIFEVVFP